ncbi:MAG: UvrD-helicase domain-containing protein [Candidatus Taylorbacteria bacterium]
MTTLNDAQQRAVETTNGPVLIIAGAGSGKTRVITQRILHLIKTGVAPRAILAITFTNKAAKEMRERVLTLLSEDKTLNLPISYTERPFVSTFHALGVHVIRENAKLLGLTRHFTIFDRSDSRRAVKDSMVEAGIDPKKFDASVILNMISRAKGDAISRLTYSDHAKGYTEEVVAQLWEKYELILAKEKALDFDDLLVKTAELLTEHPAVKEHYAAVWKYIHVDEYQDTNKIQYKIVKLLAEGHRDLCVVGDADQNIYSWRGATIENILNFEKDYPEATVITLEKNYRSTKNILAAANDIIEKNTLRKKKTLFTDNDEGEKISLIVSYTEVDEARAVADTARSLIDTGVPARSIAVLYRTNFQSRALEESFIKKNIPYQLVGVRFFERKEIKDILSYIRASLNRDSWSDIGRIINVPTRGIGKATIAKIMSGASHLLPPNMLLKLASFYKLLDDIQSEISIKKTSESVRFVIQESGIENSLRGGDADDEERLLNIRELVSVATQYDHLSPEEGMEALLSNAALASDQDDLVKDEDAVKLMTVHAAKGLEFDFVFIAGMEQDLFPFKHMDDGEISQSEEEEERRLFYVALTRARKKVYLSYTILRTIFGTQRISNPSEFIEDIAKDLIDNHVPEKPSGAKALFIDF